MNDHDKNNLNFLLNLKTKKEIEEWSKCCTPDDFDYAMELLQTAKAEIEVQLLELEDDVEDLTQANQVINQLKEKLK